jgi:hypothetical protein
MDNQAKLDLVAGAAILIMFIGAYVLTISRSGMLMIAGGTLAMALLFLKTLRSKQ